MASPISAPVNETSNAESPASPSSSSDTSSPSSSLESPPITQHKPPVSEHVQPSISKAGMTSSSTPLGSVNAARRPPPPQPTMSNRSALPQDLQARMKAFHLGRQGTPPSGLSGSASPQNAQTSKGVVGGGHSPAASSIGPGGVPTNFRLPPRPVPHAANSSPAVSGNNGVKMSLAAKRGMAPPGGLPGANAGPAPFAGGKKKPGLTLSQMNPGSEPPDGAKESNGKPAEQGSLLDKYSDFIDKRTGALKFKGKAILTPQGVEFSSGSTFNISLDEVDTLDELGKGNYGTVYKVRHSRPRLRRPGQGLAGNRAPHSQHGGSAPSSASPTTSSFPSTAEACHKDDSNIGSPTTKTPIPGSTTGVVMAMKEIRLELDEAKFAAIIMELDILHRCVSPFIIDFYGAFFQEGAVYICMEFMNGGSIDKLYGDGVPENVLRKIALATTMGLKALKDEHNIIHRDVKPTNILVNTAGQVKICDFGVSGNLVASIAKTNIGCQSYMAPERISSGGVAQAGANPGGGTYSVQSDIWSLGLTIIECALGQYPYPPETYDNIFSQLSAIVDGDPPDLPSDRFSPAAHDFVRGCLMKIPKLRPTYAMLMQHAWFAPLLKPPTISEEDEAAAEAGEDLSAVDAAGAGVDSPPTLPPPTTADKEIAEWVQTMLERRRNGTIGNKTTPALHTAPLDAVGSPDGEK